MFAQMESQMQVPVLVAPRPVRLSTAPSAWLLHSRRVVDQAEPTVAPARTPSVEQPSASTSPLLSHPSVGDSSAALEEFLSILRPSAASPNIFSNGRRPPAQLSFNVNYKRSLTMSSHSPKSPSLENFVYNAPRTPSAESNILIADDPLLGNNQFIRSAVLSSPISRTNTRNPFQRHPSYEIPAFLSPSVTPASPALSLSSTPSTPSTPPRAILPAPAILADTSTTTPPPASLWHTCAVAAADPG
ncbi:hypothetical protein ONZ45_g5492 [Pleurotus djamor]|nr:hypothetical protein ONZ45_g5492 [Pleurotus djamor]